MTTEAFRELRHNLGGEEGIPLVAVPVESDAEAEEVRRSGGLPFAASAYQDGKLRLADAPDIDAIAIGSLGYGDNGGTPLERARVYEIDGLENGVAVVTGGLNAVRLLGFFENLGLTNVIVKARRGVVNHKDGIAAGIQSIRLAAQCVREGGHLATFAKDHPDFARSFESFADDSDALYPGWREKLGIEQGRH